MSTASETGFCLGAIVSNVVEPPFIDSKYLEGMINKHDNGEMTEEEWAGFLEELDQMWTEREIIKRSNWIKDENGKMTKERVSHVENEKGQKFYSALLMKKNDFLEGEKYDFLDVYQMTKNDLTDELTVKLYMKDSVVDVELKKIK